MSVIPWNVLILGRKASGKSYLAMKLIEEYMDKFKTIKRIIWISPTSSTDKVQRTFLNKIKKVDVEKFPDVHKYESNGRKTVHTDLLAGLLSELTAKYNPQPKEPEEEPLNTNIVLPTILGAGRALFKIRNKPKPEVKGTDDSDSDSDSDDISEEEAAKEIPRAILYLDDVSSELSNSSLIALIKMSRHYRIVIIMLSQTIVGLPKNLFMNIDRVYLGRNTLTSDYLKLLNDRYNVRLDQDAIMADLYPKLQPYEFLTLDLQKSSISIVKA